MYSLAHYMLIFGNTDKYILLNDRGLLIRQMLLPFFSLAKRSQSDLNIIVA